MVASPEINPRKKPKSDLTLAFMDSIDYVGSIARQCERNEKIHGMRQSAVSNQWTKKISGKRKVIPGKSTFQAIKVVIDDTSRADPNAIPSPGPSPRNSPRNGPAPNRRQNQTMTPGGFKKMYTAVTGRANLEEKTSPNCQKILPVPNETLSRFFYAPTLESGMGSD
jgi:hypothetical protein